jgi:hypothetical protein
MHLIITFGCQQVLKWFKTSSTHANKSWLIRMEQNKSQSFISLSKTLQPSVDELNEGIKQLENTHF